MKKKIIYILVTLLMSLNTVIAAENTCEGLEESDLPILSMSRVASENFAKIFVSHFTDQDYIYHAMSLNGHKSFCIDRGLPANSEDKYKYVGPCDDVTKNMAFGFYISGDYPGSSPFNWAVTQSVMWNGINNELIIELMLADPAFSSKAESMEAAAQVFAALQRHRTERYYIWRNVTRSNGQRMISDLKGCDVPEEGVCPKGQMVKSGDSLSCYVSKGGNHFTFKNEAVSGNDTNVSVSGEAKGLELRRIGSFCRLYCQEYGFATLPGALGEALQLGSYIVWPTSKSNNTSKFYEDAFPLKFTGELQCKIGVLPDKKLPFACERDPIDEYTRYYNDLKGSKNNSTYNRTFNVGTLEKLRLSITTWGPNDSTPSESEVYGSCEGAYEKNYTNEIYKYSFAKELLAKAEQALAQAKKEENQVSPKRKPKYCKDEITGFTHQCGEEDTDAYKAAKAKTAAAQTYRDQKYKIVKDIEAAINTCVSYTMKFESARQLLKEYKTCAEFEANTDIYTFSSSANLNYTDEEYKNIGNVSSEKLTTSASGALAGDFGLFPDEIKDNGLKVERLESGYTPIQLTGKVKSIKSREFTIIKEVSYKLTTGYKYVDKETKKYLTSKNKGSNYSTINTKGGVIPTSYNNKIAYDYRLTLSNISFGMAGFGVNNDGSTSTYKCPVQFTKVSNTTCVCPEGTEMAGVDLIGLIANNKMTCSDAQLLYCDKKIDVPEEEMYCPDEPEISIGACVNAGYTKSECISKLCTQKYTCKNTNGVGGKMDITSCVQTKMMQGLTEKQAIDYCDSIVCPVGKTIIYRTIKLENPFPSYNPSSTIYNGLTTGMYNNNTKGRYPGTNWNGILTVYNKIRNNRSDRLETSESVAINDSSTIGTKIYQTKEPLYTFVLNGDTIRTIRNYNESRVDGYNDFNSSKQDDNMDCKIDDSTACVSAFVHNQKYGLTGGTCYSNTSKSNFYTCARR